MVSHELTAYLSVFNQFFTQWIMTMLSKGCKPDNFESHNSLKLSFTNIWGLCLNFIECESYLESSSPGIFESYLESSSLGIFDLCETNLDDWQFLPLIQKDSATYMHGFTFYVKEGPPFAQDWSLKLWRFLHMFLTDFTSLSLLLPFPLSITFFIFMHGFYSVSPDIDEVLLINSYAKFVCLWRL